MIFFEFSNRKEDWLIKLNFVIAFQSKVRSVNHKKHNRIFRFF